MISANAIDQVKKENLLLPRKRKIQDTKYNELS